MQTPSVIEERPTKHLWEGRATGIHPRRQPEDKEIKSSISAKFRGPWIFEENYQRVLVREKRGQLITAKISSVCKTSSKKMILR